MKEISKSSYKLMIALEKLLLKKNLDDIFVSEIVKEANVSRKTFYRNYIDKYDLAKEYYYYFYHVNFALIKNGEDWEKTLIAYFDTCEEKKIILRHAYESTGQNSLIENDIKLTKETFEQLLIAKGIDITEKELQFAIEVAAYSGSELVVRWILGELKLTKEDLANLLKATLPNILLKYMD